MTRQVNDRVLVFKGNWLEKMGGGADAVQFPGVFSVNTSSQSVLIGPAYQYPEVWIYLPLVNPTPQRRQLIVDLDHNRCDTLDAYLLAGHPRTLSHLGQLSRRVPLSQRAIPIRSFALPFPLPPHDSVGLLLRSRRTTGIHELDITVSTQHQFVIKHDQEELNRLFALSSVFFFMFTVLTLGLIFRHQLLVYFGVFVFPILLAQLNYTYFFDAIRFPSWLGLNNNSIGLFLIFATNCLFHTFGIAYIKSLTLYRQWQRYAVLTLVGANLLPMGLLLFPLVPLTNALVTYASLILATLNILWLFYIALLGFLKKREYYLLITASLVFLPLLYTTYWRESPALNYVYLNPLYFLFIFGYLIISLFRRELISQQMTDEKIRSVQDKLEDIRKTEVERIGRHLHDQLGNTLASALGYLNMNVPKIELARTMILDAIHETRVISHNLVKDDNRPLDEKLDELTERFNDFSVICFGFTDFTDSLINQLPTYKQQSIFLIVQEVLNNIIKHSQASGVSIQAFLLDGLVRITIEDDGIGFEANQLPAGIGIDNMYKRAELTNLELVIDSGIGGTSIRIETPLTA